MRTLIVDTSALYALVDTDDRHHAEARAFLDHEGDHLDLVVLDTTLLEFITLVKSRLGHPPAAKALVAIQASPRFRIVRLTEEDYQETWRLFKEFADKDWSTFDCACLAAARTRKIEEALAFDRHFAQMAGSGLTRLP